MTEGHLGRPRVLWFSGLGVPHALANPLKNAGDIGVPYVLAN